MIETTFKGWRILSNGSESLYAFMSDIIENKFQHSVLKELKNNSRSHVFLIDYQGEKAVLKSPREKNTRKWIRFTTLYRKGEAFKAILNLEKLANMGIASNKPLLAAEKRRFGMVVDAWMLYEYEEGRPCGKNDYRAVVEKLKEIHSKKFLHGDPQINNFLIREASVVTIDCNPKKAVFGNVSRYYEYFYLQRSAPGIEKYFELDESTFSYRIAKAYSKIYWKWRDFKKRRRKRRKTIRSILVIRLSSIGDILLTTPVLHALKKQYPDAAISYLVMDTFEDAIRGHPGIDHLILYPREKYKGLSGLIRFSRTLKENSYDLIIDLHAKIRSMVIATLLKGKVLRYKKRALWKSILVPLRLIPYHVDDSIVRNYFKPLKKIQVYFTKETLSFHFDETHVARVERYNDVVVFAPGAAAKTKQWPAEYFAKLGRMLKDKIVLIGGKGEFDAFEEIRAAIGNSCENLAGQLSLKESGALISRSKYVLTNDSGPFHLARGVLKKVFVIFGPTDPDMFDYDENAVLIYAAEPCSPCSLHGDKICPKGHFRCMLSLSPEKVHEIIQDSLP
jgi:lipopolysaccharide heptosyltransferase II